MTNITRTCQQCRHLHGCHHHRDALVWWCALHLREHELDMGPFRAQAKEDVIPLRYWSNVERMIGQPCALYADETA